MKQRGVLKKVVTKTGSAKYFEGELVVHDLQNDNEPHRVSLILTDGEIKRAAKRFEDKYLASLIRHYSAER